MDKKMGVGGIGALVMAAAIFHASTQRDRGSSDQSRPHTVADHSLKAGKGPWVASCSYWAPTRSVPAEHPEALLARKLPPPGNTARSTDQPSTNTVDPEGECGSDPWGIPSTARPANGAIPAGDVPDIRALIATVPDPVHSHLALEFDRSIDSLMQAAGDNRYLGTNYWLPWKSRGAGTSSEAASTAAETEEDLAREQQPGLIILKYGPKANEPNAASASYHHVVYLFLVGESPSLGINGPQLRNALAYEAMLETHHGAKLSLSDDGSLAVIGPYTSGSAASLREGLENAPLDPGHPHRDVVIAGGTSTTIASMELNATGPGKRQIHFVSFAENSRYELRKFFGSLNRSSIDVGRVAILAEDGTAFGYENSSHRELGALSLRFPREISLLRNAQGTAASPATDDSSSAPSPYLSLTLKDTDSDDTVPHFSKTQTPVSQEAELIAIALQLQRNRTQYVLLAASNILDELFLAQFLHRACPDAQIVFYNGGDLLIARDGANAPYVGSIVITPYTLMGLEETNGSVRAFSDSHAERAYNAASFVFSSSARARGADPPLADYRRTAHNSMQIPLWATTVGNDGYYPLGVLSPCASATASILPTITAGATSACSEEAGQLTFELSPTSPRAAPSLFWFVLCAFLAAISVAHTALMLSANYWSAFTRDLALRQNDQPRRRSVYMNIGTAMLFSMTFLVSFPLFAALLPALSRHRLYTVDVPSVSMATVTLLCGLCALIATLSRTLVHSGPQKGTDPESSTQLYAYFNLVALIAAIAIPSMWCWICLRNKVEGVASYVGLSFSYRSLHPASGVSPVIPVLLLLLSWYLWSVCQTARLRFSTMSRPRLPEAIDLGAVYPLYVSDTALTQCKSPTDSCLIENVTCLLITREALRRFTGWSANRLNTLFFAIYITLFAVCILCGKIHSLERFVLHPGHWPTAFEFLIGALFFPLIVVALTGWIRMIFIWGALSRGLLEPLERTPLRFAFTRLKEVGWITMLSQSGLHIRWRDMARSTESMRQLLNNPELAQAIGNADHYRSLVETYDTLVAQVAELRKRIGLRRPVFPQPRPPETPPGDDDLPEPDHLYDLGYIYMIEKTYAAFCEHLLRYILLPYWNDSRVAYVEQEDTPGSDGKKPSLNAGDMGDPTYILLSEELLAIRYVALIRSVLVNMRYLMLFVSSAFVLAIIGWNSYPFQPHQLIDWCFTLLLFVLGCGFVWVFAQMHRNAILSRITDTKPNELGRDFYLRMLSFGGVPVLTWLAYQFPGIGGTLFRLLQPSIK